MNQTGTETDNRSERPATRKRSRMETFGPPAEKGERLEEWMLTYMDTVTLLVTLFVLILSFASISEEKFNLLVEGLRLDKYGAGIVTGSTGIMDLPSVSPDESAPPTKPAPDTKSDTSAETTEQLEALIAERGLSDLVQVKFEDGLIDLQLQESVLFPSASAELISSGVDVLDRLRPILASGDFNITVQGHTDSIPISTDSYPSNWELSGARASSVVRELIRLGIAEDRLEIAGFAHTDPIASNENDDGRTKNRRVNIVLQASPEEIGRLLRR